MTNLVLERQVAVVVGEASPCIHAASKKQNSQENTPDILRKVVSSVRFLAEEGDLPLFTWTLGLPQGALIRMLEECALPSWDTESLPAHEYDFVEKMLPETFNMLRLHLFHYRTGLLDVAHADYLARAVAASCFGSRPLWQDLGLGKEEDVSILLATFFNPLYRKNKHCKNWRRYLFSELHVGSARWSSIPEMLLKCILNRQ